MASAVSTSEYAERQRLAASLNEKHQKLSATELVALSIETIFRDRITAISSFGAESAVLLHLISRVAPEMPIIFLDTDRHFPETLAYKDALIDFLGLKNCIVATPRADQVKADDPDGNLATTNSDLCCHIRKTMPMIRALQPFNAYFTGRKRFQAATRSDLMLFEPADRWIRVNPLATMGPDDLAAYAYAYELPKHPLTARGYPSIGCFPCTKQVAAGADPRSGRWAHVPDKVECGIHVDVTGKVARSSTQ